MAEPQDRRSHPTVRPHALALGVLERPGAEARLAFLGAPLASELVAAMVQDTLGCLSTFPVRHRVLFDVDRGTGAAPARAPATWKRHVLPAAPDGAVKSAFAHLLSLGVEATLLVAADGPALPLGELFDGLMALTAPGEAPRVLVGRVDSGELLAVGLTGDHASITEAFPWSALAEDRSVEEAAGARGIDVLSVRAGYLVDSPEGLRRLGKDVEAGAFAPSCRKLLERAEMKRFLA